MTEDTQDKLARHLRRATVQQIKIEWGEYCDREWRRGARTPGSSGYAVLSEAHTFTKSFLEERGVDS